MSTVRTCTTPKDGWALYSHLLGNLLLVIQLHEEAKGRGVIVSNGERVIYDTWAKLAGNLYMVMRRMKLNGHEDTAAKMQQIVDMVVEQDLTNREVRKAIHGKHRELDIGVQEFEDEVKRLLAERVQQ